MSNLTLLTCGPPGVSSQGLEAIACKQGISLKILGFILKIYAHLLTTPLHVSIRPSSSSSPPPRPPHQNKNCKLYICAWNLDPVHLGASRIPCPTPSLPNMRANSCVASLELRMHEIKDKPHQCHINKEISRWNEKKKTHTPNQHTNS